MFSVETRVRMIKLLKNRSLCLSVMACRMNMSPAAVSLSLPVLREKEAVCHHARVWRKENNP
ncbi:MAG: ArsR family transcriptional regulator [Acidobacteriota bacterium]